MNKPDIEWNQLLAPIIIFTVVIMISLSLIMASYIYTESTDEKYKLYKSQFRDASSNYLKVDEEKELIKSFYPEFVKLYESGLIGMERRLNWIETIKKVSQNLKIPTINYEISSQEIYADELGVNTAGFQVYHSAMTLKMDIVHELDLIRFIDGVDRLARGYFIVTNCTIERRNRDIITDTIMPNLSADCRFNWLNIKKANGENISL